MFSQRSFATTASPYKSAKRGRCYIKISHHANYQIVTTDTPIDFHFFRNCFNIALAKDKDRNPVVLQMEAKRNNEVYVSKNSFTTPVFIKEKEDENWKSILVSDGFYLTGTVYVKVDTHEIKMEKIDNYQIPENKPKPATPLKSSVSKQNSSARDRDNQPRIQSPQVIEDSPVKERKPIIRIPEKEAPPKGPKKPVNLWDYFGNILNSDSESPIKKNHTDTTTTKSISQQQRRVFQSSEVQEISGKDYRTTTSTSKNDEPIESLLNKRREIQDLADFEEKISLNDKHKNKKIKSNADCINLEPENSDVMESEPTKKQVSLNLKKKVIKILDDDEEENREKVPRSRSPRRNKNNNTLDVDFEEEKMSLKSRDTAKDSESDVIVLKSPRSPSPEANQEDSERTKLKRLKKIVDNRRDTLNKQPQSATKANKDMMLSQEIRNQHGKVETCPICLNDILKDLAKLDSCIHAFCFDCIKDWANVTNECPYCKARFNEISKYSIGEKGEMTKIDSHKVEFKKQVYEEEINYIEEEDVDDCCYECENNDNQNVLLICDECGFHCCHTYCCDPPLDFIPEEDWFCRFCEERRRRPAGRSSSRRNQSGRQSSERSNNNNINQNQRTTRRSAQNGGQSLLQRLFSIADRENNNLPDSDLIHEISSNHSVRSAESVDLDETTNQYQAEPRPARRLNRLQRNNRAVENPEEEEEEPARPRRLNRAASRIGEIEEEFNSNSEELPFSTARARRYASRNNPNQNSTRMNIENSPMNPEDLNQFRYSLRSHGRSNTYSRID